MKWQEHTIDLPAYWAPALINGDETGLSDQEQAEYHAWLAANPELAEPVGCSDYPELGLWGGWA